MAMNKYLQLRTQVADMTSVHVQVPHALMVQFVGDEHSYIPFAACLFAAITRLELVP